MAGALEESAEQRKFGAVRSTKLSGNQYDEKKDLKFFRKLLGQGSIDFFFNGPDSKYFRFVDHKVSVTTVQLFPLRKQPQTVCM